MLIQKEYIEWDRILLYRYLNLKFFHRCCIISDALSQISLDFIIYIPATTVDLQNNITDGSCHY